MKPTNCSGCSEPLRDCLCEVEAPTRHYFFWSIDGEEDWCYYDGPDTLAQVVADFLTECDAFGWHEYPNTFALTCCAPEQPDYDSDPDWFLSDHFHAGTVTPILGDVPDYWLTPSPNA